MNVNTNQVPGTINPYTHKTAQQAFNASVKNNVQNASKVKLWAIRVFSDIASVFTQPAVILLFSAAVMIAAMSIPGVNVAATVALMALNVVAAATFGVALAETLRGRLNDLSKYFAAKADLAKTEIDRRNAQFAGHGRVLGAQP